MIRFALVLMLATLCASCGLKGPLYMPEKPGTPVVITPATQSSSSSSSSVSSSEPATP